MTLILAKRSSYVVELLADSCYADGDLYLPYGSNRPKVSLVGGGQIAIATAGAASIGQQLEWFAQSYFECCNINPGGFTSVEVFDFFQKFRAQELHLATDVADKSQHSIHFLIATSSSLHEVCDDGFIQQYELDQVAAIGCGSIAAYPLITYGVDNLLTIAETVAKCLPHVTAPFHQVVLR